MRYAILAVVLVGAFFAINYAFSQQEKAECISWQAQRVTLSGWQVEQCKAVLN